MDSPTVAVIEVSSSGDCGKWLQPESNGQVNRDDLDKHISRADLYVKRQGDHIMVTFPKLGGRISHKLGLMQRSELVTKIEEILNTWYPEKEYALAILEY